VSGNGSGGEESGGGLPPAVAAGRGASGGGSDADIADIADADAGAGANPAEPLSAPAGGSADTAVADAGANETDLLSGTALTVFRLNGQFLEVAERLARPAGLTAAWWQVLGAVLYEPLPVSGIARVMGITRQSVQRIADLLVDQGLAEYLPNPAHRTAKLLGSTEKGRDAVRRIVPAHAELAGRLAAELGVEEFAVTLRVLTRLSDAVGRIITEPGAAPPTRPRAS